MGTLRLGVFASGRGSNFQAIHRAIEKKRLDAQICLLLSNNPEAGAWIMPKNIQYLLQLSIKANSHPVMLSSRLCFVLFGYTKYHSSFWQDT